MAAATSPSQRRYGHLGVYEGNGGDLRIGLPLQSLHDGARWVHTPLRSSVFIEAPRAAIDAVLAKHAQVRALAGHGWISLFQLDETEGRSTVFDRGDGTAICREPLAVTCSPRLGYATPVGWRSSESTRAVADVVDGCGAVGGPIVVASFEAARAGDWRPFDHYLDVAASDELERFHTAVLKRLVGALVADPDRLTAALIVLNEFQAAALGRIARRREDRVLDGALDGVISIDEHGVVTEFNPSAVKIFGRAREDAIGRVLADLVIPPRMRAAHTSGLARAATGIFHVVGRRVELVGIRANGEEFPVELSIVATRNNGAQMFTGFLRDLTESKRAESSVAVWGHALDRALFGVAVSDIETGKIQRVNQTLAEMLRYPAAELVGRTATDLVSPDSHADLERLEREIRSPGSHSHEIWLRRGDGTDLLAWSSTSVVETHPGGAVRVSTLIDVTDRHRLEQAMRASADRLQVIASAAREFAAASGGVDEVLALVARRLCEILGEGCFTRMLSADGLWLEPSTAFYYPDENVRTEVSALLGGSRQRVGEGLAGRVAATRAPVVLTTAAVAELPPQLRDLAEKANLASALAVPLQVRGRLLGVVALLRSASRAPYTIEDQQLASELADRAALAIDNGMLVASLELRVLERTRALEDANRELESFSYSVSHDLRAPLRAINGFTSALGDYEHLYDEQGKHYLARISAATHRMANLIDDMIGLARIGRARLSLALVDVSAMVHEVISELREPEPQRDVTFEIEHGLQARADARLLRIVLQNLLGNAWKFTSKIAAARISVGRAENGFFVRDNGAGFDMAYVNKLFLPFQRLHTPDDFDGTGIGLATVDRIVRRHGGSIRAEAAPGQGACFVVVLTS